MYCSHCGYDLSDKKIEKRNLSLELKDAKTDVGYVCPRCGHIIKEHLDESDVKAVARAAHAEIHRARNNINSGLCFLMITIILACICGMFYLMSFKANQGGMLVTDSTEFYVCIALLVVWICTLAYSIYRLVQGITKHKKYSGLLKDIQNNVFIQ